MFDREEDKVCDGGGGQRSLAASWLDNSLKKGDLLLRMVESRRRLWPRWRSTPVSKARLSGGELIWVVGLAEGGSLVTKKA